MRKIRNILPVPTGGVIVEPGALWHQDTHLQCYGTEVEGVTHYINKRQAADRRLFEPVEEPFLQNGDTFLYIVCSASKGRTTFTEGYDQDLLECGNCFRCDTNLNPAGVHIDDAIKVFRLALRVPRLWRTLMNYLGADARENEQVDAVYGAMLEIEAASQPQPQSGGSK